MSKATKPQIQRPTPPIVHTTNQMMYYPVMYSSYAGQIYMHAANVASGIDPNTMAYQQHNTPSNDSARGKYLAFESAALINFHE